MRNLLIYVLFAGCMQGCSLGPDYFRDAHAPTLPEQYRENDNMAAESDTSTTSQPMARWWERIEDPLLNGYVERLLQDNLSLKQASERVIQATERVRTARSNYFPSVGANGTASRSFSPGVANSNIPFAPPANRNYVNTYNADLSIDWQIDLFGRIGRAIEGSIAAADATAYDREATLHSLIAELVRRRVAIATHAALTRLAEENTKNRDTHYRLVKRRYQLGVRDTQRADVHLAQETASTTRADVEAFRRTLSSERYALDILLGKAPGATAKDRTDFPLLPPPRDIPLCLPASLLDRRPDVRAAELRLVAANADIGVSIGDLYPNITVSSALGVAGNQTANLFSSEQLTGSLLGSITNRIFEGGALRANIRIQESEARELAAAYAETILNAVREVETAIQSERTLTDELTALTVSLDALRSAERLTEERYIAGLDTLRDYLDTQQRRYITEQQWLQAQQALWQARIDLYLALGGDWLHTTANDLPCRSSPQTSEAKHAA
jgi:multidrug efflux system outer membrane protein